MKKGKRGLAAAEVCFDFQVQVSGRRRGKKAHAHTMMQTRDRVNWNTLGKGWGGLPNYLPNSTAEVGTCLYLCTHSAPQSDLGGNTPAGPTGERRNGLATIKHSLRPRGRWSVSWPITHPSRLPLPQPFCSSSSTSLWSLCSLITSGSPIDVDQSCLDVDYFPPAGSPTCAFSQTSLGVENHVNKRSNVNTLLAIVYLQPAREKQLRTLHGASLIHTCISRPPSSTMANTTQYIVSTTWPRESS